MIGLGWLETFLGSLWLSSSGTSSPVYWSNAFVGVSMILLGYRGYTKELKLSKSSNEDER